MLLAISVKAALKYRSKKYLKMLVDKASPTSLHFFKQDKNGHLHVLIYQHLHIKIFEIILSAVRVEIQ